MIDVLLQFVMSLVIGLLLVVVATKIPILGLGLLGFTCGTIGNHCALFITNKLNRDKK